LPDSPVPAETARLPGSTDARVNDAPPALNISSVPGALAIAGVRHSYLWHASGNRIALVAESALWSIRPDGSDPALMAHLAGDPLLVGPYADGIVYLEQHPGVTTAYLARPTIPPRQVARMEHGAGVAAYPVWATIWHDNLLLVVEGHRPQLIDLTSGEVRALGEGPIPVRDGDLAFSAQEGVLAYKLANRGDAVRLLRMDGTVLQPGSEAQLAPIAWSPSGDRWAVRAVEPGRGLPAPVGANLEEGGTHLAVGDASGRLEEFRPPEPLVLVAGPWWSPDGTWLAVVSGTVASEPGDTAPEAPAAPARLWVVDVEDGRWRDLGPLPEGAITTGFHPATSSLVVHDPAGAALWPVDGGEPQPLTPPWAVGENPAALEDGSLLFLSADARALYLQRPGAAPRLLVDSPEPMGALTAAGNHAALLRYGDGAAADLLLVPLPGAEPPAPVTPGR